MYLTLEIGTHFLPGASTHEEETDLDHHNGPTPPPAKSPSPPKDPVADMIQNRLMSMLESCGVLAIQRFLLETGAVTEIKDHLRGDFTVIVDSIMYRSFDKYARGVCISFR